MTDNAKKTGGFNLGSVMSRNTGIHRTISSFIIALDKAKAKEMIKRRLIVVGIVASIGIALFSVSAYYIFQFASQSSKAIQSAAYYDALNYDETFGWSTTIINSPDKPKDYSPNIASIAGPWPFNTYNPSKFINGDSCNISVVDEVVSQSLTPSKIPYSVRVEIEPGSVNIQTNGGATGATSVLYMRAILPQAFYNYSTVPPTRLFDVSCVFFDTYIVSTANLPKQSEIYYATYTAADFVLREGSVLYYPFDAYTTSGSVVCRYTNLTSCKGTCDNNKTSGGCDCDPSACSGLLNVDLAVAHSSDGFFAFASTVYAPYIYNSSFDYFNEKTYEFETIYVPAISPAVVSLTVQRATINQVFPIYFAFLMWVMVLGNVAFSVEFYLGLKPVTTAALALSAISLLFALPNVRNTMPGNPPLGVIIDFFAYFWCLVWAMFCLGYLGHGYLQYSLSPAVVKQSLLDKRAVYLKSYVNVPLTDLSVEEVAALLINTGRGHIADQIRDLGITGSLLTVDLEKLGIKHDLSPVDIARYKQDVEQWKTNGVDPELLHIIAVKPMTSDGDNIANFDIGESEASS